MEKSFMFVLPVLQLNNPEHQLLVAEQEKALRKEEFELARHRLMNATSRVNNLKMQIHFTKNLSHE